MEVSRRSDGTFEYNGQLLDGKDASFSFTRGFYGIGIFQPDNPVNVGMLGRSALAFQANHTFLIGAGERFNYKSKSNTAKGWRHHPYYQYRNWDDFRSHLPNNVIIVAVDNNRCQRIPTPLNEYQHQQCCVYLMGSEAQSPKGGLPDYIIKESHDYIYIPSAVSLNVAVASSIVLWDRFSKRNLK